MCEYILKGKQCENVTSPSEKYCVEHTKKKTNYALEFMKDEVTEMLTSDDFLSLDEETAMCRVVLQSIWNMCRSKEDMTINATIIAKQMEQIQKMVQASHSMRVVNNEVLTANGVKKLVDSLIAILTDEIEDDDTLDRISARLFDVASTMGV